ncbi:uncharacterized protein B0H18DRAFT_959052 [Fomitopsis serialis]|uniref:uncharacterized protein n=1 Tax=Fomitopsis serialis TaxID=139415 RepID=UPI002008D793|nr:uncharacterized protein B0H18DRAFT_959052 [Neoantrodia serialis]KAH9916001.1 hypothetical protein B0H18DRAFT_959052 [Neoantrodia serialis]
MAPGVNGVSEVSNVVVRLPKYGVVDATGQVATEEINLSALTALQLKDIMTRCGVKASGIRRKCEYIKALVSFSQDEKLWTQEHKYYFMTTMSIRINKQLLLLVAPLGGMMTLKLPVAPEKDSGSGLFRAELMGFLTAMRTKPDTSPTIVTEYLRLGATAFWEAYTQPETRKRMTATAIHKMLQASRAAADANLAQQARQEYPHTFNVLFSYKTDGKKQVLAKESYIATRYQQLQQDPQKAQEAAQNEALAAQSATVT